MNTTFIIICSVVFLLILTAITFLRHFFHARKRFEAKLYEKLNRNDVCLCGSGLKYKRCDCYQKYAKTNEIFKDIGGIISR